MYHFIGIKGAGMSSLAVIMKELGYEVKGSDLDKHFFTESELIKNNINFTPYNENNITKDLIIIKGASITDDNVELIKAKELNLQILEYNEMVGILTRKFKTICIAGCHGKTTTTAMIAHVLNSIVGINYLIGDGTGYAKKENTIFALESCEYKRHFLAYLPYYAIILNIDLDHVDYYKDINDIINAYEEFANKSTKMIIACGDDPYVNKMHLTKPIIYFGLNDNNNIRATNINYTEEGTTFDVTIDNNLYGHFDIPIYAHHQLLDALAVITLCICENIAAQTVEKYFKTFTNAKRRFTQTIASDSIIIDDYAHHPNEVKATLDAVKQKYPNKKIVAIFQPHTFSRTKAFAKDLAKILKNTYKSYIMDIHPARERQEDYQGITKDIIINNTPNAYPITINDAKILNEIDNAVFVFMSPNDISKLEQDLIKLKQQKHN